MDSTVPEGTEEGQGAPTARRPGPREALRRHRARNPSAGRLYLEELDEYERQWLNDMTARVAWRRRVDRDDLYQYLVEGLLEDDKIDRGRPSWRAWLEQRAHWKAEDLRRSLRPDREQSQDPDDLVDIASADHTPARPYLGAVGRQHTWPDTEWSVRRLGRLGLNLDESRMLLLVLWGIGMTIKEFAETVDVPYTKARKDSSTGMKKIVASMGLTDEERTVYGTWRRTGSVASAAQELEMDVAGCAEILAAAAARINEWFEFVQTDQGGRP